MGGVGFTKDYPVEKYYRDCKIGELQATSHLRFRFVPHNQSKGYGSHVCLQCEGNWVYESHNYRLNVPE